MDIWIALVTKHVCTTAYKSIRRYLLLIHFAMSFMPLFAFRPLLAKCERFPSECIASHHYIHSDWFGGGYGELASREQHYCPRRLLGKLICHVTLNTSHYVFYRMSTDNISQTQNKAKQKKYLVSYYMPKFFQVGR